ncbi:MAG: pyridoxal-phosphate dependent enzyme, partial [Gammaproteobacteria bacterium]
ASIYFYQRYCENIWNQILVHGVVTCSTGNFAKALSNIGKNAGFYLNAIIPNTADKYKVNSILEYSNTNIQSVPYSLWKNAIIQNKYELHDGFFISTVMNDFVSIGNASIGIELLEDLPEISSIIVPYGGGNLVYSLALFFKIVKPSVDIYTVEVSTGAPFNASFKANKVVDVNYINSFVDGIGASFVIPEQYERIKPLVKDSLVVSPAEIADIIVDISKIGIIAEGAGAASIAAFNKYQIKEPCCSIVTGGNISQKTLKNIFDNKNK